MQRDPVGATVVESLALNAADDPVAAGKKDPKVKCVPSTVSFVHSLSLGLRRLKHRRILQIGPTRVLAGMGSSLMVAQVVMAITGILSARWLGPSGKGLVAAASTWGQLLGWFVGLGLGFAIQVRIAEKSDEEKHPAISSALGNGLLYAACVGTCAGVVGFVLLTRALAHLGPDTSSVVALTVLPIPLGLLASILASLQLGLGRHRVYALLTIAGPISTLAILLIVTGVSGPPSPVTVVLCYLIGGLVAAAFAARQLPWMSARIDLRMLLQDIRFGAKTWLTSVMGLVSLRLDLLILTVFVSAGDIGLYSAANNIMMPITALPYAIALLAAPRAARLGTQVHATASISAIWKSTRDATLLALAGGVALAAAAPVIVPLLLGNAYRPAIPLIWILIAGYVARAVVSVIVSGANGMRRPRAGYLSEGIGLMVTLILLPILLPRWGITGAAAVSTAAYIASGIAAVCWLAKLRQQETAKASDESITTPAARAN
jgi:O-antigen/teichoic acid export membrane protein